MLAEKGGTIVKAKEEDFEINIRRRKELGNGDHESHFWKAEEWVFS